MHCHPNARRTPRGRADLFEAVEAGMTVTAACAAYGVSRRCYYRWLPRWRGQGRDGLLDRSSRPHTSPGRLHWLDEATVGALRRLLGWGPDRIAPLVGCSASTAHRALDRAGLIERGTEREPVVRYEHDEPGSLIHLDTKKLGRIVGGPGHRGPEGPQARCRLGAHARGHRRCHPPRLRRDPARREEGHHDPFRAAGAALVPRPGGAGLAHPHR